MCRLLCFLVPTASCWLQRKSIYLLWLWLFPRNDCESSPALQCCLESLEGWAGSVSAKHSCISPTKKQQDNGSRVIPGFSGVSPQIPFYRSRKKTAADGLCCIPGSSVARGCVLMEHPRLGLPYLPHLLLL